MVCVPIVMEESFATRQAMIYARHVQPKRPIVQVVEKTVIAPYRFVIQALEKILFVTPGMRMEFVVMKYVVHRVNRATEADPEEVVALRIKQWYARVNTIPVYAG